MIRQNLDAIYFPENKRLWYVLALQGGFVNVGGFLAFHHFVSHVTGFAGQFSVELMEGDGWNALFAMTVPLFFLLGSFFSGLFTEVRRLRNKRPIYVWIMSVSAGIYFLIAISGQVHWLGPYGQSFIDLRDYMVLAALCFVMGAQNAMFTSYSSAVVRTTHLTGVTTDLGIGWAKQYMGLDHRESQSNLLRLGLILSFLLGSLLGSLIFMSWHYLGFLVPALIAAFVGRTLYKSRRREEVAERAARNKQANDGH